jgi:HK97 family phage prohead protease
MVIKPEFRELETAKRSRCIPEAFRGLKAASLRSEGDTPKVISGYGAVFYNANDPGTEYRLWTDYYERIMPGAFDRALREDDVRSMFNHDSNQLLGRRAFRENDTLKISVDNVGLRYEVQVDMTDPTHQSLVPKLRSGKVDGASFMFEVTGRTWREEQRGEGDNKRDVTILEITEVRLWELGPVVFPAYESATSEARSLERRHLDEFLKTRKDQELSKLRTLRLRLDMAMRQ